jgi:hypothetical protein
MGNLYQYCQDNYRAGGGKKCGSGIVQIALQNGDKWLLTGEGVF